MKNERGNFRKLQPSKSKIWLGICQMIWVTASQLGPSGFHTTRTQTPQITYFSIFFQLQNSATRHSLVLDIVWSTVRVWNPPQTTVLNLCFLEYGTIFIENWTFLCFSITAHIPPLMHWVPIWHCSSKLPKQFKIDIELLGCSLMVENAGWFHLVFKIEEFSALHKRGRCTDGAVCVNDPYSPGEHLKYELPPLLKACRLLKCKYNIHSKLLHNRT